VAGDQHRSDFEYTTSSKYGTPRRYTIERLTPASMGPLSVYRDPASAPAWLLSEDDGTYPPIWIHEVLVEIGAVAIRWFSAKEWADGASGQELPY
jgi:hypothetical protein